MWDCKCGTENQDHWFICKKCKSSRVEISYWVDISLVCVIVAFSLINIYGG